MVMAHGMVLWHAETGKLHHIVRPPQGLAFGSHVTFSSDSRLMAARCYKDGHGRDYQIHVHILDVETGGQQYGHSFGVDDGLRIVAAEFAHMRDRDGLIMVSTMRNFILYDPVQQTQEKLVVLPDLDDHWPPPSYDSSLNLKILIAAWKQGILFFPQRLSDQEQISVHQTMLNRVRELFRRNMEDLRLFSLSRDRNLFATARANGEIWIWDMAQTLREAALSTDPPLPEPNSVSSIICSKDGNRLVAVFQDGTFQFFDRQTGELLRVLRYQTGIPLRVAVSNNAEKLVFTVKAESREINVVFWDVEGWQSPHILSTAWDRDRGLLDVAISPDGKMVAASIDGCAHIWDRDLSDPPLILEYRDYRRWGHTDDQFMLALSPTGEWLVATREGHFLFLQFSTDQLREISTNLPTHVEAVYLEVSPDQKFLVAIFGADSDFEYPTRLVSLDIESQDLKEICPIEGRVRFTDNSTLSTVWGTLELGNSSPTFQGWGVNEDCSWILFNRRKCLWVPPEYRAYNWNCLEIVDDLIMIGCPSGRVWRIKFQEAARNLLASCPNQPRLEEIQLLS